jgi:hypothetical protein
VNYHYTCLLGVCVCTQEANSPFENDVYLWGCLIVLLDRLRLSSTECSKYPFELDYVTVNGTANYLIPIKVAFYRLVAETESLLPSVGFMLNSNDATCLP